MKRSALAALLLVGCAAATPASNEPVGVTPARLPPPEDAAPLDAAEASAEAGSEAGVSLAEAGAEDPAEALLAGPAQPAPDRVEVSTDEEDRALDAWLLARARAARAGQAERVRVPLVLRAVGTGCRCPEWYLGHSADTHSGGPLNYLSPRWTAPAVPAEETGALAWVEGRFTGEREWVTARDYAGVLVGRAWVFEVLSVAPEPLRSNDAAAAQVLRARPPRGAPRPALRPRGR